MLNSDKFINFKQNLAEVTGKISGELVGWISVVLLHFATVPSMLALMKGYTDNTLPIDLVLMIWGALTLFFLKAVVQKDVLNILTIGLGFVMQATMLALIFFK